MAQRSTIVERFPRGTKVRVLEEKTMEGWPILSHFVGITGHVIDHDSAEDAVLVTFPIRDYSNPGDTTWFHESQIERGEYRCSFVPEGEGKTRVKRIEITEHEVDTYVSHLRWALQYVPVLTDAQRFAASSVKAIADTLAYGNWREYTPD